MKFPLLLIALTSAATPALAEPLKGVAFAGGTVSDNASGYAGAVIALPGAQLGKGFAVKVSANGGRYEYDAGATHIKADYYGGEVALVHQWSGQWGWVNISAGPRLSQTDLTPGDPGNKRAGTRWDAGLASDGALDSGPWRLGWFGEWGIRDESYIAKAQLTHAFDHSRRRAGVEITFQGDPNYRQKGIGGVFNTMLGGGFELQLSGGATDQPGRGTRAYGSLGFSKVF